MSTASQPIILIGCPRSGTTLLRRLLGAHKEISCPGESFVLRGAARFLAGERVAEGIDYGPLGGLSALGFGREDIRARVRRLALSFHEEIARAESKPRIALKTAVDSFYLRDIHAVFGGHAKFVCLLRHGGDVALSLAEFCGEMGGLIEEMLPFVQAHRRMLPAFGAAWAKVTADMLDLAEEDGAGLFALRYEDLVVQPRAVIAELFDFLEAPCDAEALMEEAFRPREVRGLGDYKTFATSRIDASRSGRWQSMPRRVQAELAPIINPVLARAGYQELSTAEDGPGDGMRLHELAMMFQAARQAG